MAWGGKWLESLLVEGRTPADCHLVILNDSKVELSAFSLEGEKILAEDGTVVTRYPAAFADGYVPQANCKTHGGNSESLG